MDAREKVRKDLYNRYGQCILKPSTIGYILSEIRQVLVEEVSQHKIPPDTEFRDGINKGIERAIAVINRVLGAETP